MVCSWPALAYCIQNVHKSILKVCKCGQVTITQWWTLPIVCGMPNNYRCYFGNWLCPFPCVPRHDGVDLGQYTRHIKQDTRQFALKLWSSNNSSVDTVTRLQAVGEKNRRSILVKRLLSTAFRPPPGTSNYLVFQYWGFSREINFFKYCSPHSKLDIKKTKVSPITINK